MKKDGQTKTNKIQTEQLEINIEEITQRLFSFQKEGQIKYTSNVIPNSKPFIGVRIPELRKIAREIAKVDYRFFLEHCPDDYFEQQTLQALVLGYAKDDIEVLLKYADNLIPKIQDWAVNDSFCQTFSIARKNRERVWEWLQPYAAKDDEFSQRVVAVLLMSHFLVDEYIDQVLAMMDRLQNTGYYRKMGVAWCVATAYAKYPKETFAYMKKNQLDDWTYNKSIQKMKESFRVSAEDKIILNAMKRGK